MSINLALAANWLLSGLLGVTLMVLLVCKLIARYVFRRPDVTPRIKSVAILCAITIAFSMACYVGQSICLHYYYVAGGRMR